MSHAGTGRNGPDPEKLLNPEWVEAFLADVADGVPILVAAEANGLNRWTFYPYMLKGGHPAFAGNQKWTHPEDAVEPYGTFVAAVVQAEASAHRDIVRSTHRNAQIDVNAGIRYMKTRYPDDYDRGTTTVIIGDTDASDGVPIRLTREQFERMQGGGRKSNDEP